MLKRCQSSGVGYPASDNATFWCDRGAAACYQHNVVGANHSTAWGRCDAQGGVLWWPRNASEELAVERWFGLLNNEHGIHLGITRGAAAGASSVWTASDGAATVGLYPSSTSGSYAHWGSDHYSSGGPFYDASQRCALAQTWALAYDIYTCGPSSTSLANGACYQKTTASRKLAWRAIGCSARTRFICRLPRSALPCTNLAPPSISPCLPPDSAFFFCNTSSGMCYQHNTARTTFSSAVARCKTNQGGQLWYPRSADEAGAVESSFGLMATNGALWLGLQRTSLHNWHSVDGSYWVPEWPTTGVSYGTWAHWGSDHFDAGLDINTNMDCVIGQTWGLQYALMTCDPTAAANRKSSSCYQTAASFGSSRHLAWRAVGCGAAVPYVCAIPTSGFQCPPPPQPHPPPSPPTCEVPAGTHAKA